VFTFLGWLVFRRSLDRSDAGWRFANSVFAASAVIELVLWVGILYAVYRLVRAGSA